jgi:hypothetical protein
MDTQESGLIQDIDSPDALREFADEVRERAKTVSKNAIENQKPQLAMKALWMLSQGAPVHQVSKTVGLSHEAIRKLEWRHNDTLESKRREFSQRYAMVAAEYTDLLFDRATNLANSPKELNKISPDRLALVIGIMTDKSAQLSGMATSVVEHRKGASLDEAAKMIEEARMRVVSKDKVIEAEVLS